LYPSAFCLRRYTTLLTPSSAGQLGRKLRKWGVHKYDSKNRSSDTALQLGVAKTLPDPDEMHSILDELPEPLEYDDADPAYTTLHDSPPAVIASSNNPTTSVNTSQRIKAHEEDVASSVPTLAVVTQEPENGRLSDIDMDRLSLLSSTSSVLSGFASLRSLAQRILLRQGEERSLRRESLDDPPSSVMDWNRSSSSLQLFVGSH
jgi:hypothetical protein